MQRVPSNQSNKTIQQTNSEALKTSSNLALDGKTSSTAKKGDETKRLADNTDHTTVSASFCGCKKDKCDAFFDKLLCYLEKQSDIIAKCCTSNRERRKGSSEKLTYDQKKTTEKSSSSKENPPKRHPSPCKDEPEPASHRRWSVETEKSVKGKDEDSDCKPSRYKSQLDVGGGRQLKLGDKPCNIYVEVCSCQKDGKRAQPARSPKKLLEADSDQCSSKQRSATPLQHPSGKSNEYVFDCHGCEKKVSYFFRLAEEICQGYMKQCQEQGPDSAQSKFNVGYRKRNSREDFGNQVPSRPYQSQLWNERSDEDNMKPEKQSAHEYDVYNRPHARPIAIEIECQGTKEEFIVEPCQCESRYPDDDCGKGKVSSIHSRMESHGPKKSCIEVFEERYGKILRDLHAKLFSNPNSNSPQGYPQQGYPPNSNPPPAGFPPNSNPPPGYPPNSNPPPGYPQQGYPPNSNPPPAGFPPNSNPPPGYPQQGYPPNSNPPPAGFPPNSNPPPGYPQQGFPPNSNPPPGYPQQGYPPNSNPSPGFPPNTNPPPTYSQQGNPPHPNSLPGYPPPGYSNPYGDAAPHIQQQNLVQQPPPATPKQEEKPSLKETEDNDSSEDRRKTKKKDKKEDKKKNKKKGSKDS